MTTTFDDVIDLTGFSETLSFQYTFDSDNGTEVADSTFTYDGGANLTAIAAQMREFLAMAGFDYVTDVTFTKNNGDTVSASEYDEA